MKKVKLTFTILSFWHAGSGAGEGAKLDAVTAKKAPGLPYLPGKTVKGLLREAVLTVEECGQLPVGITTEKLFGKPTTRYDSTSGLLEITDATMSDDFQKWAKTNQEKTQFLFSVLSATRIDENGTAKDDSLRSIEVAIPMSLTAFVQSEAAPDGWFEALKKAAPFVRHIGSHRHRGLGRTMLQIEEV